MEGSVNIQHLHVWRSPLVWVTVYKQADLHFTVAGTRDSDRLRNFPREAQL